ncbi:protein POLR1D-like [Strongylocentrotus purpuratus]|uniref:Uncharacterized protein n=1 Tax=Strongylocentrotus purpuratus TaxID=7668 RepID=A0A7M7NM23_STRPU|nr:protein POLR1D-like [Strongylocentrotus purpuratus]
MEFIFSSRLAAAELLNEAGRGKERASTMGPNGWKKRQVKTNKVFLKNTLRGVISGNRHQSSSRVEKRHKDGSKRTDTNLDYKDENKSQKLDRGSHHDRLEGTYQERDRRTLGHSSRRDDFHSKESCSQTNSKSSGGREKKDRYHRTIFCEDASCSSDKGKECKTISRKYTSAKEK